MKPSPQAAIPGQTARSDEKGSLRAFIALEVPDAIQQALALQIASLQTTCGRAVRWVACENIHLTLKFLGELAPARVEALSHSLLAECSQQTGFEVNVSGLGGFPNLRRPRVIWAGLQAPPELGRLQRGIELAAARLGCPVEQKPFSAHLTIGRVREQATPAEIQALQTAFCGPQPVEFGRFSARSVTLFKSELRPAGPLYTPLFSAHLGD